MGRVTFQTVNAAPSGMTLRTNNPTGSADSAWVYDLIPSAAGATRNKTLVRANSAANTAVLLQIA